MFKSLGAMPSEISEAREVINNISRSQKCSALVPCIAFLLYHVTTKIRLKSIKQADLFY